jgi:hypothetical protein
MYQLSQVRDHVTNKTLTVEDVALYRVNLKLGETANAHEQPRANPYRALITH